MKVSCEKKDIRLFATTLPVVVVLWGIYLFLRYRSSISFWLWGAAVALFIWGRVSPATLKPIYRVWTTVTHALGWFMTAIVMAVVFVAGFTIISLIMRLFRFDPLHRKFDPNASSYWLKRPGGEIISSHYERQF